MTFLCMFRELMWTLHEQLTNAGDTLYICIPRLSAEWTTGVIRHFTSLATEKLSAEQEKRKPDRRFVYPCYDQPFQCLLVL